MPEEIRKYWEEKGVLESKQITMKEYQLALEKWKSENPDKEYKDISQRTVVEINGKRINLGDKINLIRNNQVKLTLEDQKYWEKKEY